MEDTQFFVFFDLMGIVLLLVWISKILSPTHHLNNRWQWQAVMLISILASISIILCVLLRWASFDVVDSEFYIIGYLNFGIAWISLSAGFLGIFTDIRFQQDVRDRNNLAAAIAIGGLLIGSAIAYAGANIGDGPGFHVVIFSAFLSTVTVYGAAWALAGFSDGEERISVDHDIGAAMRLAALVISVGIISGRSVAGNWISVDETIHDFMEMAWPVLPLCIAAILCEKTTPPNYSGVGQAQSIALGLGYIGAAIAYVATLGSW